MVIYYLIIILTVVMFGGGFALQDVYRKKRGSNLKISMESACIGSLAGLIVLFMFNGFSLQVTWFSLLMAVFAAVNGIAFTFCAFKSLDYINLSLFSLFSMYQKSRSKRNGVIYQTAHGLPLLNPNWQRSNNNSNQKIVRSA